MNEDLRDVFAMAALAGLLGRMGEYAAETESFDEVAQLAYRFANAMIKAREQQ